MKIIEKQQYRIPLIYVGAIFNADFSGLNDSEISDFFDFEDMILKEMGRLKAHFHAYEVDTEEKYFCWYNDVNSGKIGADCADFTISFLAYEADSIPHLKNTLHNESD